MFRKVKKKNGITLTKRILNDRINDNEESHSDHEMPIIKQNKKKFKGLSTNEIDQILIPHDTQQPLSQQIGSGSASIDGPKKYMYKDKQMEEYIHQRMVQEKIKLQTIGNQHGLINPSTLLGFGDQTQQISQQEQSAQTLEQQLYTLPDNLDVEKLVNNREIVDKPIQWTAGMMEMPVDPLNKLETVEQMIHQQLQTNGIEDTPLTNPGRKVISRASRGGFGGSQSLHRIAKGEYSNMMKTLHYDHHQSVEQNKKSERTQGDRKKFEQTQQNMLNENS